MLGTSECPLRVAIIGAGPSGFYAAGHLLAGRSLPGLFANVDLFDKLPTPYGLVRAGVAPDHPKIKSVTRVFDKTASHPRFRFFGGAELGRDLSREALLEHYHAVIYAFGTASDRKLAIAGEQLSGSVPATQFVAWYNGHPDACEQKFDLSSERAVVIGNGNVAIDVARMLLLSRAELARTDMADHAIDAIDTSAIREVVICGRRGPAQAAFTNPEILELGQIDDVDIVVDAADLQLDDDAEASLDRSGDATARKNLEILREYAARGVIGAPRRIVFRFLVSPIQLVGDGKVEQVVLQRNQLVMQNGALGVTATGETETLDAGLVVRAVGYRGEQIAGIPFDGRAGLIPNKLGRVTDSEGNCLPGEYAAGWIKRGPSGVIGTNKKCAAATVDALLADLAAGLLNNPSSADPSATLEVVRTSAAHLTDWGGWRAIDQTETTAGELRNRPRVKLVTYDQLHRTARTAARSSTQAPLPPGPRPSASSDTLAANT